MLDPKINFTGMEPASSIPTECSYLLDLVLSPYNIARLDAYVNNLADYLSVRYSNYLFAWNPFELLAFSDLLCPVI